jgi:hypothetical protein
LDQYVESWFAENAKIKGVNLQSLINYCGKTFL